MMGDEADRIIQDGMDSEMMDEDDGRLKLPVTERGFRIFDDFIADEHRQTKMRVQESSAALRGPCVWIFGSEPTVEGDSALHLTVAGAKQTITALQQFVTEAEANELCEPMENIEGE